MISLAWWAYRRPRALVVLLFLSLLGVGWVAAQRPYRLLPMTFLANEDPVRQSLGVLERDLVGASTDLAVLVQGGSPSDRQAFVDALAGELRKDPQRYRLVLSGVDLGFLRGTLLYYLKPAELGALESAVRHLRPVLEDYASGVPADQLLARAGGSPPTPRRSEILLGLARHYLDQLLLSLDRRGRFQFQSPVWGLADPSQMDPRAVRLWNGESVKVYSTLDHGQIHVLTLRPGPQGAEEAIQGVRRLLLSLKHRFPGLRADLAGAAVVAMEQAAGFRADLLRAGFLCLVSLALLFGIGFKDMYRPAGALVVTVLGALGVLAVAPLMLGLTVFLGVFLGAILSLCLTLRVSCSYSEQRRKGSFALNAWRSTMRGPGKGFVGGLLTLSAAMASLALCGFPAVAQVGLSAAATLLACLVGSLIFLPAWMGLADPVPLRRLGLSTASLRRLERGLRARSRWGAAAAVLLLSLGALSALSQGGTYLQADPMLVLSPQLPTVVLERSMERRGLTGLCALCLVNDADQARSLEARLRKLPAVGRVDCCSSLIPPEALSKEPIIRRLRTLASEIQLPPATRELDLDSLIALGSHYQSGQGQFESLLADLGSASPRAGRLAQDVRERVRTLDRTIRDMGPGPVEDGLLGFERGCLLDMHAILKLMRGQRWQHPAPTSLPPEIAVRSVTRSGKLVLRVYPAQPSWNPEHAATFLQALSAAGAEPTGGVLLLARIGELAQRSYAAAGGFVWMAVLMVLMLRLMSLRRALQAMIAPTLAWFWTTGFLALAQVPLNLANFVLPPLMLGVGASLAVENLRRRRARGGRPMLYAVLAVTLVSACLATAESPALSSVGLVLSIGLVTNWLAASWLPSLRLPRRAGRLVRTLRSGASAVGPRAVARVAAE